MKKKFSCTALLFFIILSVPAVIYGQSLYSLKFRMPGAADTSTCTSLLVINETGSGFMRISQGKNRMQADLQLEVINTAENEPDTSTLLYATSNPVAVTSWPALPGSLAIWFKANPATGDFEPVAITAAGAKTFGEGDRLMAGSFINTKDITKELLAGFFTDKEPFYENILGSRSKGGSLTPEERKTKMYLLVVASTNDSTIGPACLKDAELVRKTLTNVADFLKIRLVLDTVLGSTYNKKSVEDALARINPVADRDIVIFYYSGHGFKNDAIRGKEYPFMDLRDPRLGKRPDPRQHTLNVEDVFNGLRKKKAKLTMVISDCCNDEIVQRNREVTPPPKPKNTGLKYNFDNAKNLFIVDEPTAFLVTAASKDERAGSMNSFGSIFTSYFFGALNTSLSPQTSHPLWEQIVAEAQLQTIIRVSRSACRKPPCKQTPKLFFPK